MKRADQVARGRGLTNHLYDALFAPHTSNDAVFLKLHEGGRPSELRYSDFVRETAAMAHALLTLGIRPGDRVVVQAPKRSETLVLYAATIQAGAVFLPLNTAYQLEELQYFIDDAAPTLIVVTDKVANALASTGHEISAQIATLNSDGTGSLTALSAKQPDTFDTVPRGPNDLAALLYTSGTTGRSKGAMLSHANLLSNASVLVDLWRIEHGDVLIHALPIFHTHGLFVAINTAVLAGAAVDFMAAFDLDMIVDALPRSTLMMGVPTFYTRLLADARLTPDTTSTMRLFISGSAPLLAETHTTFTERSGHKILERYGMTETNMSTSNPYDGQRKPGTVGLPLPGVEVRLTIPGSTVPVQPGDVGMIEVRGPNVFQGYWQMPDKTAEELRSDGFFITGDLGRIDEDGYISIVGRQKDLIITGGLNVYPKEVEDVLNDVPGVVESAVYGVPDADFGERIIADVVGEVDENALRAAVTVRLARFKQPKQYRLVEALPRNTMGKVQKNILRDAHKVADQ